MAIYQYAVVVLTLSCVALHNLKWARLNAEMSSRTHTSRSSLTNTGVSGGPLHV